MEHSGWRVWCLCVVVTVALHGCMNITASVQPENLAVPELRESSDCVPIVFGLAYGSATVEGALAQKVRLIEDSESPWKAITGVRRIQLHDYHFLFFGARCVEVVGE